MKEIPLRLEEIRQEIREACLRSGRKADQVKLIAVSKNFPVSAVEEAYQAGQRSFGENRVQELRKKKPFLPQDIQWHLIGTLQRNKVKDVVDQVELIHSLDSVSLAKEISKHAQKKNLEVKVLLQVNIAEEASKFGFSEETLLGSLKEIASLPGIKIKGLMTMAPLAEDPEEVRWVFRRLAQLAGTIGQMGLPGVEMQELSMGMSDDFRVAVEEGATLVRIGTRIFGARNYQKEV